MASFQERIEDLTTDGFSKSDVRRHAAEIAAEADARIAEFERHVARYRDACKTCDEWVDRVERALVWLFTQTGPDSLVVGDEVREIHDEACENAEARGAQEPIDRDYVDALVCMSDEQAAIDAASAASMGE